MNHSLNRSLALAACGTVGLSAATASAGVIISEDFTGNPAAPFVEFTNYPGPFSVANDAYTIDYTPSETNNSGGGSASSAALIDQDAPGGNAGLAFADGDFTISVDVAPTKFTNTGGTISLRAFENNDAFLNFGVGVGLVTGFGVAGDDATLSFFIGNTPLASPGPDESATFVHSLAGDETSYNLLLSGDFVNDASPADGDLILTAIFTPDPADNPNGLAPITITTTVDQATVATLGINFAARRFFGITQAGSAGNDLNVTYDNFLLTDEALVIPEPGAMALAAVGGLAILSRWRG
ncbi:MAG: hypothetical protein AAF823_06705 [Planctomycetota bacterium]